MADDKIAGVGSPLTLEVAQQINTRRNIVGKLTGRTSNELLYLNGNTAWIRLSSGVNTLIEGEAALLRRQEGRLTITGDSTLAKSNRLQGGILLDNEKLRAGLDLPGTPNETAAYRNNPRSTGIRPMPGITSMNVQSKNTYGTLREAEVKFSVWSLEDFETIEQLYLRPGFTMLLEWGHSLYYGNDNQFTTHINAITDDFFKKGTTMSDTLAKIGEIRKKSSYNYEAMIGYVKNFSWNYKPNGEYECSISIISTGEIIESLKLVKDPGTAGIPESELEDATSEEGKDQRRSIFHFFNAKIEKITENPWTKNNLTSSPTLQNKLKDFKGYFTRQKHGGKGLHWIPLYTFLDIINKFLSTVDQTKAKDSIDRPYIYFNTDYKLSSKFITFPGHFSADPTICVLQHLSTEVKAAKESYRLGYVRAIHSQNPSPENGYEDVLNILVSVPYILKLATDAVANPEGKFQSINEFVQSLLNSISTALGGINDFSIAYDEEVGRGTYFIIDRNNTNRLANNGNNPIANNKNNPIANNGNNPIANNKNNPIANNGNNPTAVPTLYLIGNDSIFTGVNITSKITNEIASQISIAAQGASQNTSENIDNILRWNPDVIDRLNVTKDSSEENDEGVQAIADNQADKISKWEKDVFDFFNDFNDPDNDWKDSDLQAIQTLHKEVTVQGIQSDVAKNSLPVPSPIPVELSFTLDGLGGFKVGHCFYIAPGILPSKYEGKFGYIITGVEHSIGNTNRWETSIKTQFYLIEKSSPEQAIPFSLEENIANAAAANQASTPGFGTPYVYDRPPTPPAKLIAAMKEYGITSPVEKAHFLSQCCVESVDFKRTTEETNGAAYENRKDLGNIHLGDGKKYKGRGFIQLTGRDVYTSYNKHLQAKGSTDNVVENPLLVSTKYAEDSACYFWKYYKKNLSRIANDGPSSGVVILVTKLINGGSNGLQERLNRFNQYWGVLQQNPQEYT